MAKRLLTLLTALVLTLNLTGCSPVNPFRSTEELYALPKASEEYTSLQEGIQVLLDEGKEYSPPLSGTVTQPVRLRDLDGDGENEALVFLRDNKADTAPLVIYIFKKMDDGLYAPVSSLSGEGTNINNVLVCQLMGDESSVCELVVSWQVAASVYTISAYSLEESEPMEIMTPTAYTRYGALDIDSDGEQELVLLTIDKSDDGMSTAVLYDRQESRMSPVSAANLSYSLASIDKTREGMLADQVPALYVTGTVWDENGSSANQLTDILTLRSGELCNVTLDSSSQNSDATTRYNLTGGQDINEDGFLEIPIPFPLPSYNVENPDTFYGIEWQQYTSDGSFSIVSTTYYNSVDGWYLELPESWQGHLCLARQDITAGSTNERGILFYSDQSREPFLAIYKNSGTNKESRALSEGRFLLGSDSGAIYSAELMGLAPGESLSSRALLRRFHLIKADWSLG